MLVSSQRDTSQGALKRRLLRGSAALSIGALAVAGLALPAQADDPSEDRVLIPPEQVSIQMYSLNPWVNAQTVEPVMERLSEIGFQNIEPWGGTFTGYSAAEFRDLADGLGISVPSSHYNVGENNFDDTLEFISTLGQEYAGSGGFAQPGINSYENTLATAQTMNRLGKRSVEAGVGKFFGHNHASEFTTTYEHNGEELSAWEILVQETHPDYVTFEVDVGWASHAGVDVPELLGDYGDRIELLHIKDATGLGEGGSPSFTNIGEGDVAVQAILEAAVEADVQYYVLEYDNAPQGEDFAVTGFEYLTGIDTDAPITVPADQVSVQMFSLIPWVNADGLPSVLRRLAGIGFENIEPYGGTFGGHTAESFHSLTSAFGINVPSSHYNVGEANFDDTLEFVDTVGQEYVGSGGFASPGINTYSNTIKTAKTMNRLGKRSVEAGVGKFFGHNHASEFTTKYMHNGEELSAWEILVQETDPEYVTFQVDVGWASHAEVDVPRLLYTYGDRIDLLHIKDATGLGGSGNPQFTNIGDGEVDMQNILRAAQRIDVQYYVLEYDMAPQGENFVETGFEYLTGLDAGEGSALFGDVPAGHSFGDEIYWMVDAGLTTGYADGTFRPKNEITREAMAAFLFRLEGDNSFEAPAESPFSDVGTDHTFYKEITWLADAEITSGYSDGTFRPKNEITREAMSAFLYRLIDPSDYQAGAAEFSDVGTGHSFFTEISWMADQEITSGYSDGTFRPKNEITREATAAFLYRVDSL